MHRDTASATVWNGRLEDRRGHPGRVFHTLLFITILSMSACGVTYTSPSVQDTDADEAQVNVIELTSDVIAFANRSTYSPRSLPKAFYSVAGNGSFRGAGALPISPDFPEERPEANVLNPPPQVEAPLYRIGIGDVVLLATRGTATTVEQLSGLLAAQNTRQGYTVRDDGAIAIPEIGTVSLAGLTLQEAEDALFQALVENQIDPSFSLEMAEFNSQRVAVGGAVRQAQIVPITISPLTLGEAITAAGGVVVRDTEYAAIRLYRDGKLYQIPVDVYLKQPDLQKRLVLNGDAVFIDTTYDLERAFQFFQQEIDVISLRSTARAASLTALQTEIGIQRAALQERRAIFQARAEFDAEDRDYVYLAGEVVRQSRVPLPYERHATLADILYNNSEGSGFDVTTADASQIYVLRALSDTGGITAYHLDAQNIANMVLATKMQMRPNDIVFIEEQIITKWSRSLNQIFPAVISAAGTRLTAN